MKKTTNIYNLNTLVRVEIRDEREAELLQWQEERKGSGIFGFFSYHYPAGVYHNFRGNPFGMNDTCLGDELFDTYLRKGNEIYFKPCVKLHFIKGSVTKYFDTHERASRWGSDKAKIYSLESYRTTE